MTIKDYGCVCGKAFSTRGGADTHIRMKGEGHKIRFICECGKRFNTSKGLKDHARDKGCDLVLHDATETKDLPVDARRAAFEMMAEDLPDGAYFAMAEEFGLSPEDLVDDPT